MNGRRNRRKRSLKRVMVTMLTFAMLLSVCFPGMMASAEEVVTEPTESQAVEVTVYDTLTKKLEEAKADPALTADALSLLGKEISDAYQAGQIDDAQFEALTLAYNELAVMPADGNEDQQTESSESSEESSSEDESESSESVEESSSETTTAPVETTTAPTEPSESEETTAPPESTVSVAPTQELLDYLLTARTYEELDDMMENMTEEQYVILYQFSDEQNAALTEHVNKLSNVEINVLADMSIEQGTTGTREEQYIEYYGDYRIQVNGSTVSSSSCGITLSDDGDSTITVTVSETTPVGEYTIQYGNEYTSRYGTYFDVRGEFTIQVTAKVTSEDTVTPSKNMTFDKTVTARTDGNYDLKLTLSGAVGSQVQKAKLDILLIVDTSGSMKKQMTNNQDTTSPNRRIDKVTDAVESLISTINSNADKLDVQYSLVQFDGPAKTSDDGLASDASTLQGWTSNGQNIISTLNNISPANGTNYEAGINQGITQLNASSRTDAQKIVIFLTDGLPTAANNQKYSNNNNTAFMNAAINAVKKLSCNQFYCIGAGPDFSAGETGATNLSSLINNVGTGTGATAPTVKQSYLATNTDALNSAFAQIATNTLYFLCENVTITDTLNHVGGTTALDRMVEVTDPESVIVTVYKGDEVIASGKSVTLAATENNEAATLTASYNSDTGVLKLDFPDDYQLEPDYTYVLSAVIAPTEKAYEEYRNGGYTESGEANTGTHSGEFGFYSNDSATVTYTYNGETSEDAYDHPVVQLNPGKLVITKSVVGIDAESLQNLTFELTITYPGKAATTSTVNFAQFTDVDGDGIYTYEISGLSPNTTYKVEEKNSSVEGYNVVTTVNGSEGTSAQGTVARGATVTVPYVNTYSIANTQITLKKTVSSTVASDLIKEFTFNVTVDGVAHGDAIKLKNGETATIKDVPIGSTVVITEVIAEAEVNYYTVTAKVNTNTSPVENNSVTISSVAADDSVEVINTRNTAKVILTKYIKGNMGDINKKFSFTATAAGVAIEGIPTLANGDSYEFTVPVGAEVVITEGPCAPYIVTATVDGNKADVNENSVKFVAESTSDIEVDFTNTNEADVDTGVSLDTFPMILLFSTVTVLGAMLLIGKKRYQF